MIKTVNGDELKSCLFENYFNALVNNFFKILPMKENKEKTLSVYVRSFQSEMLGLRSYVPSLDESPLFLSLLAILQFFADEPDAPVADVKREVFKAIRICNRLAQAYSDNNESEVVS